MSPPVVTQPFPTLGDFAGTWHLSRSIHDRNTGTHGVFAGTATFSPDGTGLIYIETGLLRLGDAPPMKAERRYLWNGDGARIIVSFDDGRPFHDFLPDAPTARHWCTPDIYEVSYDFADWPLWSSTWDVSGPRKAYQMTSRYSRAT